MEIDSRFTKINNNFNPNTKPIDMLNELLVFAQQQKASSLIVRSDDPVWVRIDGKWIIANNNSISNESTYSLLNSVYGFDSASGIIKSGNDLDFSYEIRISRKDYIRFRVNASAIETRGQQIGTSLTFRPLPATPPSTNDLQIEQDLIDFFIGDIARSGGLVIVSGETGSGKSTLLSSLLREKIELGASNNNGPHIISYEAPIEYDLSGIESKAPVEQSEIPKHIGSWEDACANSLRREADIIFFGEARTKQTFTYMLINAEQGSQVVTTLHARKLATALTRILSVVPEKKINLLSSISLMIHQYLVNKKGGGRVALREYLSIDTQLKEELLKTDNIESLLQRILDDENDKRGRSLAQHAKQLLEQQQITDDMYKTILSF